MSNTKLQTFRSYLTERFTTAAVEIFGEVETIVEAYYEENKRLRSALHMVLSPEIKTPRIDVGQYTGATASVREQPPQLKPFVHQEISEPLPKKPKEEQIECDISLGSEQRQVLCDADHLITPDCVKNDPEEEDNTNMPCITNSFHIQMVAYNPDYSVSTSAEDTKYEHQGGSSLDSGAVTENLTLCRSEESTSECWEPQKHNKSEEKKTKFWLQKTKLELPRMMPDKSFVPLPDCQSFLARLTETFKDLPDDKKPLITKMDLTTDVELVDCAFGKVPKGCPLSYQCPVPSSEDYKPHDDAPPQPLLPLSDHRLEPVSTLPPLSVKEQEHLNVMQITWDAAHSLEHATRRHMKVVEGLRKLRLTSRFKEICKLKPGRSHAEQLIRKIRKGVFKRKRSKIEEEMKADALREYCDNLHVNWSPCGLVVHPDAPWLGVLPDGLVYDPKENPSYGLVHVKCSSFQSFSECPFLVCQKGVVQVKTNHSYYWQIQGEMMVTGMSWCDLFVFSRQDLLVQRIYRDTDMINVMKKKLHDFFFCHYLPCHVSD